MLKRIWITPPMVFARVGGSPQAMANFTWGPDDIRPRGTGKTTLVPLPSLDFNDDGTLFERPPGPLKFKDEHGFRPACPFVELHGEWDAEGESPAGSGPITPEILETHGSGISAANLTWTVSVGNLKPFHMTQDSNDRIAASVAIQGNNIEPQLLRGLTPNVSRSSLVQNDGTSIPLGTVRLARPNDQFPGFRLRFFAPKGLIYGPTNLTERLNAIPDPARARFDYRIPSNRQILNPDAAWCRFRIDGDSRTNPGGLFAVDNNGVSVGLVDDVSDGLIRCELTVGDRVLSAAARVAVGPPDYAPDRRPLISLADGLKDRVERDDQEVDDDWVRDLFERAWETMGLLHVEFQNARVDRENPNVAYSRGLPIRRGQTRAFTIPPGTADEPLPMTERGRRRHRQLASIDALKNLIRHNPNILRDIIRPPAGDSPFYTIQMPALMRGSDRYPLHLTRRQYDMLMSWADSVIESP